MYSMRPRSSVNLGTAEMAEGRLFICPAEHHVIFLLTLNLVMFAASCSPRLKKDRDNQSCSQ